MGRPGQRKSYQNTKSTVNLHFSKDFFLCVWFCDLLVRAGSDGVSIGKCSKINGLRPWFWSALCAVTFVKVINDRNAHISLTKSHADS